MRAGLVAWLIAGVGALCLAHLVATTPWAIALASILPPACVAAVLMRARRREDTLALHLAAVAWGAVGAASLSAVTNDALTAWVASVAGEARARLLVPALGGPVVEELAKGVGLAAILAMVPRTVGGVVGGIVCGALVGLGFTMTENVGYLTLAAVQGGAAGIARAFWVRAVLGGFTHAVFTATVGAGIAWSRDAARGWLRRSAAVAAFAAALVQHVLWNAVASQRISAALCSSIVAGGPCRDSPEPSNLLVFIPLVAAAGLAPGALVLWALAARSRR